MKANNLSLTALIILFTISVASFFLLKTTSYGQAVHLDLPPNLNVIEGTTGQDNIVGTNGDDLFILYGAGSRWNWDNIIGNGGTNYIQMPTNLSNYVSATPFSLGGYLFESDPSTNLGTVWANDEISYIIFDEGIFTLDEAADEVNR